MEDKALKAQFDTIRESIDEILRENPENLASRELLELTHQLDSLFAEHIKNSG